MHTITGQWKLGLTLALTAALMWGVLPVALKPLLGVLDAYTITCFRFAIAALALGLWQARRSKLPPRTVFAGRGGLLIVFAAVCLAANYGLYLLGLNFITPSAAQVTIQLAPMLFLVGGMVFFHERFTRRQWGGFAVLTAGLVMFFNHRLAEIFGQASDYTFGVTLIVASAACWAAYALAQKQLLVRLSSINILLLMCAGGTVLYLPFVQLRDLLALTGPQWALLGFTSLNTVVAYGAFAEALEHWEASRVSAVLASTPLLTLGAMILLGRVTQSVVPEPVNGLSIAGACLVVAGSIVTALAGRRVLAGAPIRG